MGVEMGWATLLIEKKVDISGTLCHTWSMWGLTVTVRFGGKKEAYGLPVGPIISNFLGRGGFGLVLRGQLVEVGAWKTSCLWE